MHCMSIRVYYEDTDSGGIVYYANYLKFMERARTEFLRELGFEQNQLRLHSKRLFVVKSVSVNYLQPATFDTLLDVTARIGELQRASLTFMQQVRLAERPSDVVCEGQVRLACIHADTRKPVSIPTEIKEAFASGR